MRVGIDARVLIGPHRTGIAKFLQGMLDALGRGDSGHEYVLYSPKPLSYKVPAPGWRTRVFRGVKGTNGQLWMQLYLWRLAQEDRLDAFWGPAFHLPVLLPRAIPALVTVHDLVHLLYPRTMETRNYLGLRLLLRPSLWRARYITADSMSTAGDLTRCLGVPEEKISVVYPGVGGGFRPRDAGEAYRHVARAFGFDAPYLLTVSTVEPRKNLLTLLRAYAMLEAPLRKQYPLVIAGGSGWRNGAIYTAADPLVREGSVRFLGYVPDDDLPWLYAGATLFLFPSLYEGFGIPILEAMTTGIPVIASDIPVMREVAGDAVRYVPPVDVRGWSATIAAVLDDPAGRARLGALGLRGAGRFTYEKSAARLLALLERVAAGGVEPIPRGAIT